MYAKFNTFEVMLITRKIIFVLSEKNIVRENKTEIKTLRNG